jgi:hypothetical protein
VLTEASHASREGDLVPTRVPVGDRIVPELLLRAAIRAECSQARAPVSRMLQGVSPQPDQHAQADGPLHVHRSVDVEDHGVRRRWIHDFTAAGDRAGRGCAR